MISTYPSQRAVLGAVPGIYAALLSEFNVLDSLLSLNPDGLYLAGISTQFQDTAGTTPANSNNDPVGRVNDSSPNSRNLLRLTADGNRPVYLTAGGPNGLAAWDFNAGKGFLNGAFPSPTSGGIVTLVNFDSTDAFAAIAARMDNQSWGSGFALVIASNGFARAFQNAYNTDQNADAPIVTGTWYVLSVLALGDSGVGSVRIRVNGVEIAVSSGAGAAINYANNNFFVGSDTVDNLDGKMSAVLMLDPDNVPAAEAALMQWAGL